MNKIKFRKHALALIFTSSVFSVASLQAATLQCAVDALKLSSIKSLEFSGTGHWYQFGKAPAPDLPWSQFAISSYTADINYEKPAARIQIIRK